MWGIISIAYGSLRLSVFHAETSTVIVGRWNSCHGNNCHHLWCPGRKMRRAKRPHIVWQTVSLQFPSIKSACHMACSSCEGSDRTSLLKIEGLKELTTGRNIREAVANWKREKGRDLIDSLKYLLVKTFWMCQRKKPLIPYLKLLSVRQVSQAHERF